MSIQSVTIQLRLLPFLVQEVQQLDTHVWLVFVAVKRLVVLRTIRVNPTKTHGIRAKVLRPSNATSHVVVWRCLEVIGSKLATPFRSHVYTRVDYLVFRLVRLLLYRSLLLLLFLG